MVEFQEIKRALQSATLKHRREGVKQLEVQLSSPKFLRQLDVNTVKLWPEDRIQLLSWPGLVDTYLNYMHKEVIEHKKQLDATAIKVFKTIFTAADSTKRCGPGRNNLLRRAGVAFDKLGKILEMNAPEGEGLGTALGKEVASVLVKVLLPNSAYCQRATVEAFQGLIEEAMLRFEALQAQLEEHAAKTAQQAAAATATGRLMPAPRGGGAPSAASMQQEMFTVTNLLMGLLSGVPGQMAGLFVVETVAFFAKSLAWLDKQGEYGRTSRQLMACLNGLLLTYGADLRPNMPSTHKMISNYMKHAWTAHTSVPVKDGVLCFCRVSLALGGMPTAGGGFLLNDLLSLVTREINAPAFTWDLQHNKQHQQLAPLAASLYYHAAFTAAASTITSSTPAASGGPAVEIGSCGSTGDGVGAGRQTQARGKRRASDAEIAATPAARAAAAGGGVVGEEGSSDDEVLQLPRKRSRVLGPAGQLLMHLQADADRWGPIVALLLHQHGPLVPPSFLAALQQQLTATATRCITALSHQGSQAVAGGSTASGTLPSKLDRRSASPAVAPGAAAGAAASATAAQLQRQLLWLSRCLCGLALCWPAALHPLSTAGSSDCGSGSTSVPSAGAAAGVYWDAVGTAYSASDGNCSRQAWQRADVFAAQASCSNSWQQLWDNLVSSLAAGSSELASQQALQDSITWLLHVLVARRLVSLPNKATVLLQLRKFWLPGQADPAGEQQDDQQMQQVVLSEAQLALLLSLCLDQQVSSHKEMSLRQQLLQACLSTAEAWCSSSGRRASRHSTGARGGSMGPPAPVAAPPAAAAGDKTLPDLLLPAMLALLGAPELPTPSLNGAPAAATMASAAAVKLAATECSWSFAPGATGNPVAAAAAAKAATADSLKGGADTVCYTAADVWWSADQQLESQLAGLEDGLSVLKGRLAAQQLQNLLRAVPAESDSAGSTRGPAVSFADQPLSPTQAAAILVGLEADGTVKEGSVPAADDSGDTGWWKCWCRLADEAADHLCNALLPFTTAGQDDDAHPWGTSQDTAAADGSAGLASAASDPVRQLSYLLLLLNASVSLPCIAALQCRLHEQQEQQLKIEKHRKDPYRVQPDAQQPKDQAQQGQPEAQQQQAPAQQDVFCGFGFSGHPEQHQQLQQMVMEAGIKAGQLLADNLQQLPCHSSSTWLQQLMHLGTSLARIQALMTAMPTAHGPDASMVKYPMLAAASFLAEVVKVLERVTFQAAEAASAEPNEDMDGGGAGADADFDDDFMDAAPAYSRHGAHGSTQQPAASMMGTPAASFRPTQPGSFTASRPAAGGGGGAGGAGSASGPAVHVGGGLAGFCGSAAAGLGSPSAVWSPTLLAAGHVGSNSCVRPGFAVGGLGEGLSGLAGVEGAGLRVFAVLSPAYLDTAQALLRLWRHMAGLSGWAPPEALLQAVVETATVAVCAGGWSHLDQLFGLMKGSHTLLSAQKVPNCTSHLIMRLLQQVAAAAGAVGFNLDMPCNIPESQAGQDGEVLSSQEEAAADHGTTYLTIMLDVFADVQRRLGVRHDQPAEESRLPPSTQLQLGLTTLALLQLHPQAGYSSTAHAAGNTAQHVDLLSCWRQRCLLGLLSAPSNALRARAGPLAAALLTSLSASAAPAVMHGTPGSTGTGHGLDAASVTSLIKDAVAEVSGYLFLQDSANLTPAQANRVGRRQAAQRQMQAAGPAAGSAKAELDATNREAQQDALGWEAAVVQLAALAQATTAATCVALQQQEPPNVLDAHLLLLLLRHTASLQLLPVDALPASQVAGGPSNGSQVSSSDGSSAQVRAARIAAAALDVMACQQRYSSRQAYLQYHGRSWVKEWVAAGCTVQQLLAVQPILCPPGAESSVTHFDTGPPGRAAALAAATAAAPANADAAADAAGCRQLLQAYGLSTMYWLIFYGANEELAALAAAAGSEEAALVNVYTHELCSGVYPMLKVPELKPATERFRSKLPGTAANVLQNDSYALVYSLFETSLPDLQQQQAGQQQQQQKAGQQQQQLPPPLRLDMTLPFITQTAADRGFAQIAKLWDNTHWLLALPFSPAGVQVLVLMIHRSIDTAAHPLHKLQRMGQLQCLLRQLPDQELQSPAVARSLVSILLQNLQVPELQGLCCSCLQQLLAALFAVLPAVFDEQGRDVRAGKFSEKKAVITAKQQQQQAQQQSHEELIKALLKELMPPVVAALVQCIEAAAAGLQSQQQQQLWAMQTGTAAAAAGALGVLRSPTGAAPLDLPSTLAPVSLLLSTSMLLFTKGMGMLLDLLPALPVLSAAAERQGWNTQTMYHLLPWFVERAASMSPSSRHRAAQELLSKLRRHPNQISNDKKDMWRHEGRAPEVLLKPGNREIQVAATDRDPIEFAPYPYIVKASFQLARLGAELCDAHVMQLAAELLALIGPMDSDVITLDHAAADYSSNIGSGHHHYSHSSAPSKATSTHADRTAFPLKAVLKLLVDSLFDEQPQVVSTAQDTLGALVSVVDSNALKQVLEPPARPERLAGNVEYPQRDKGLLLQSYVSTYILSPSSSNFVGPAPDAVAAALEAAASADLWSAAGKPYKQWLCRLSSTLLRACGGVQDTGGAAVTRRTGRSAAAAANIPATAAVLSLLADAAAISPQLAELLLPHAVLKLCESDNSGADVPGAGSQGWAARLGAAGAAGLQLDSLTGSPAATWRADAAVGSTWVGAGPTGAVARVDGAAGSDTGSDRTGATDVRCYSVLLTCLEHNRSIHQMALSSMPCDPAPAPAAWQRCYCLHLDYLAVAAAAMAVKAYFTALLYVEQWCSELQQEGRNPFQGAVADTGIQQLQQLAGLGASTAAGAGNGVNGAQHAVQQQQQQVLEHLLLELYGNVNEPDGIYAVVAAFGSPASQLQLLQHEQQWAAVLGGQDALLQAATMQAAQHMSRSLHMTGALTALQRLGCPATAQQCIAGALQQQQQQLEQVQQSSAYLPPLSSSLAGPAQRQQQQAQLQEAQKEIAWRLSDWGLADTLNPAAGQQGFATGHHTLGSDALDPAAVSAGHAGQGFHAAVLAALTALHHKDHESFTAQVTTAQHDCVLRLARSSTQSAAAVNPLLVQLQMLQMLAQGLRIAKSSRDAAAATAGTIDWPVRASEAFLEALWQMLPMSDGRVPGAAVKLSAVSFELSDQLMSLQAALSKALKRPDALLTTLQATMRVARKAGQVNFAAAALQQLQETLHQAVLGAKMSAQGLHGVLGLGLPAGLAGNGGGSNAVQLPGWIQRAVAAESGWPLEAVKIRWLQGQHQAALKELQGLATGLEQQLKISCAALQSNPGSMTWQDKHAVDNVTCSLMQARMLLGKWLAAGEGSTSNIQGAMQQLQQAAALAPAIQQHNELSVSSEIRELHSRVCYQLAACADQHYQMLDAQMASPEFQKQQQVLQTKEQLLEQLKSAVAATQGWQRAPAAKQQSAKQAYAQVQRRYAETLRQTDLDRQAVTQLQDSRMQYLITALSAYRNCIAAGDKHDLQVVYRMCGLWFRHSNDRQVNEVMQETFQQVPTAKFIPLVYQIASRMDDGKGPFQVVLTNALFLMAKDHTYHTLYPLIALSNGDTEGGDPAAKNAHMRHQTNTARVAAASALLQRVRAVERMQPIVDDMTAQVTDLIGMTLQVHKALPRGPGNQVTVDQYTMPANFRRRLKSLPHAPPICYTLPLDLTRNYEYVPYVVEIDSTVKIAGGINTPLIIRVTDDSGRTQKQLCKCNDDLRQDAVMQQFFGLVDTLLKGSPGSKQRRLGYRTYRVVPCSPLVGVLEWVEGTIPLTEYLLGSRESSPPYSGGASGRYHRPGGLSWMECYLRIDKAQPKDLKETFLFCCKNFPPVFRHFFLESFPHPSEWFEARTRYTRSTAVASMAGAVIGLGDRHLGNILLDMHSAEVVHIDLGIAFEQGLFLATAERVPFRLTANIVDGMGAAGMEGTFRRCCETTLQVLREHQDALLTVVQVVLHDPLYRWQMTPIKAGRKQLDPMAAQDASTAAADAATTTGGTAAAGSGAGGGVGAGAGASNVLGVSSGGLGNADAERAVLRVKQKLQGQDVEGGAALSVAAQVAAMLQAARDPENLCRMFKGWAPWV